MPPQAVLAGNQRLRSLPMAGLLLSLVMAAVMWPQTASAYQLGPQGPFMPPGPGAMYSGHFYLGGGVKYRNLEMVELRVLSVQEPGSPVFPEARYSFTDKPWTPVIEFGVHSSNFFDLFGQFSWFSVSNHIFTGIQESSGGAAVETITYNLDMTVYELRTGGRSWQPLWGIGRLGVSLGAIVGIVPFEVKVRREFTLGLAPLPNASGQHQDRWWLVGGFGGIEAEADISRFFVKAGVDYSITDEYTFKTFLNTETWMKPQGLCANFIGGFRF
ncbi:MAG: hypothetical protein FJ118_05460 [Deltaproteobacteria bacterium]|nr:hypothetical protein [Deltaproteobacteria bacterium]